MDVHDLARAGASIREIAHRTGLSRTTVRKLLRQVAPKPYGPGRSRPTKLEPFVPALEAALAARPHARASRLYDELRRQGYPGGYEAARRWVRAVRSQEATRRRACVRFETRPGLEAQFDWKGPVGGLLAEQPDQPIYLFRFLLAYSRWRFTLAVLGLELPATLWALQQAFERLGAVPSRLVFDNVVGKTHLAVALAICACQQGTSVYFTGLDAMIRALAAADRVGKLDAKLHSYTTKSQLLVLDEVGYQPLSRAEAKYLFQVVSARYERSSLILTSNKSATEWPEVFGEHALATAILDRLLHHCHVLAIQGHSYRLRDRALAALASLPPSSN